MQVVHIQGELKEDLYASLTESAYIIYLISAFLPCSCMMLSLPLGRFSKSARLPVVLKNCLFVTEYEELP